MKRKKTIRNRSDIKCFLRQIDRDIKTATHRTSKGLRSKNYDYEIIFK